MLKHFCLRKYRLRSIFDTIITITYLIIKLSPTSVNHNHCRTIQQCACSRCGDFIQSANGWHMKNLSNARANSANARRAVRYLRLISKHVRGSTQHSRPAADTTTQPQCAACKRAQDTHRVSLLVLLIRTYIGYVGYRVSAPIDK